MLVFEILQLANNSWGFQPVAEHNSEQMPKLQLPATLAQNLSLYSKFYEKGVDEFGFLTRITWHKTSSLSTLLIPALLLQNSPLATL